ncbi:unnamed protein product [Anisakis simplex]|uniref:Uncharacterized protein n=1 Tax=Anisakis simplex TaxID=6269 RepID=A0A0M3JSZ1_ANISI|nr:unnamed protein product [Anisakis simplex]
MKKNEDQKLVPDAPSAEAERDDEELSRSAKKALMRSKSSTFSTLYLLEDCSRYVLIHVIIILSQQAKNWCRKGNSNRCPVVCSVGQVLQPVQALQAQLVVSLFASTVITSGG